MKPMNKRGEGILTVLLMAMLWAGSTMGQTNWWTGDGDGSDWHDPANWNTDNVPGASDTVYLGYDDGGNVPDTPQTIELTADAELKSLVVSAVGSRQVTLSGSNLAFAASDAIVVAATAESDPVFNCNLGLNRNGNLYNQDSTQDVILAGSVYKSPFSGGGTYEWRYRGGNNKLRLQCENANTLVQIGGPVVCETNALRIPKWRPNAEMELHLAADVKVLGAMSMPATYAVIRRVGAGDRRTEGSNSDFGGSPTAYLWLAPTNAPGQGHLTVTIDRFGSSETTSPSQAVGGPYVLTSADSTVEIGSHGVTRRRLMDHADNPGITGPGSMRLNMSSVSDTFTVGREMDYTGGTLLSTGTLRLVEENGTNGALPDTGLVEIESTATFDLNAINDTIGTLGGVGQVLLGGATLTLAQGVAPGMSVGTLTVSEVGSLVLEGTSTFEINATNEHDQVVVSDADLTLGGTLHVQINGAFQDSYYGTSYKIFDLTSGTASGMFSKFTDNFNGHATCEIDVNNDVIITINRPTGTSIMVQ